MTYYQLADRFQAVRRYRAYKSGRVDGPPASAIAPDLDRLLWERPEMVDMNKPVRFVGGCRPVALFANAVDREVVALCTEATADDVDRILDEMTAHD